MADETAPTDDEALARQWIAEIDAAEKDPSYVQWLKRCKSILEIYKEDRPDAQKAKKKFALFWSNIQTLAPAVYSRTPTAVVTRRFKDNDPVGRVASEILERSLNFTLDAVDFPSMMLGCRDEYLLFARGQAWIRYIPTLRTEDGEAQSDEIGDDPEPFETVEWEEVKPDRVHWTDFLTNPARCWEEVRWCGRKVYLTRTECEARFGEECGGKLPLDWAPPDKPDASEDECKAAVYEIWDITSKRALWICKGYTEKPCDVRDDPLKLKDFFPCPKPVMGTLAPDSTIPIPDFIYYQDQSDEINVLTGRIDKLIDSLRVRGFYSAADKSNLNSLLSADDNMLIPVDSWAALGDQGGLKGIIEWFPLEQIAGTLKECFESRDRIIKDVFELTGISDIQRGDTDPDETATAQKIKATWGSSRVRDRQKELSRFARDILRIMGEIIASKFGQDTLSQMTGVKLLTNAEKAQIQAQQQAAQMAQQHAQMMAQQAQQTGQQPPPPPAPPPPIDPDKLQLMGKPSWEDVMAVLHNPVLRAFRIDIETDSTIEPNDQEEKQRRIEFVEAIGEFIAKSLPVVQTAPQLLPVVMESLKFLVRGFRVGREMEDIIDAAADQLQQAAANPQPQQQDPAAAAKAQADQAKGQAAQTMAQAHMAQAQNDAQANQVEAMKVQSNHALGMAGVQAENTRTQVDAAMKAEVIKAEERQFMHQINNPKPITADTK